MRESGKKLLVGVIESRAALSRSYGGRGWRPAADPRPNVVFRWDVRYILPMRTSRILATHRDLLSLVVLLLPAAAIGQCLSLDGPWMFLRGAEAVPPGADAKWEAANVPHLVEQVGWDADCAGSPNSSRYLSNLLANQGADWKTMRRIVAIVRLLPFGAYPNGTRIRNCRLQFNPWEVVHETRI